MPIPRLRKGGALRVGAAAAAAAAAAGARGEGQGRQEEEQGLESYNSPKQVQGGGSQAGQRVLIPYTGEPKGKRSALRAGVALVAAFATRGGMCTVQNIWDKIRMGGEAGGSVKALA